MERLLILSREFNQGDYISECSKELASQIASNNKEAHIIAFGEKDEDYNISEKVFVHKVNFLLHADNFFNWVILMNNELKRKGRELMDTIGFDAIHANDWTTVPTGIALSKLSNLPLYLTFHSTERERGFNMPHSQMIADIELDGLEKTEKVFVEKERTLNSLLNDYKVPREKIVLVPRQSDWASKIISSYRGAA